MWMCRSGRAKLAWSRRALRKLQLGQVKEPKRLGTSAFDLYASRTSSSKQVAEEFVGPVEIAMTTDGRGRGMFLTEDAQTGDLLFVNKTVCMVESFAGADEAVEKLTKQTVEACLACSRSRAQVLSLHESRFGNKQVPSMGIFKPSFEDADERQLQEEMDEARIQDIVNSSVDYRDDFAGLWTLSPFINHSCLPNTSLQKIGRSMFAYASRDMKRGTELCRSYTQVVLDCYPRRRQLSAFECGCSRCRLEERIHQRWCLHQQRYLQLTSSSSSRETATKIMFKLGLLAVVLEKLITSAQLELNEKEKQWLRASYAEAYSSYYNCVAYGVFQPQPTMPSKYDFLTSCLEAAPGTHSCLATIANCGGSEELLRTAIRACYGHQDAETMKAIAAAL